MFLLVISPQRHRASQSLHREIHFSDRLLKRGVNEKRECRTPELMPPDVVSSFGSASNFSLFVVADSIHAWSARSVSLFALPPSIFLSLRGGTCRRRPDCSAEIQLRNARVNDRLLHPAFHRLLSCPRQ